MLASKKFVEDTILGVREEMGTAIQEFVNKVLEENTILQEKVSKLDLSLKIANKQNQELKQDMNAIRGKVNATRRMSMPMRGK